MVSRISDSIFQGLPVDELVVEDAYNILSSETRNSVYDTVKGIYSDSVKGLISNKNSVRELSSILLDAKAGYIDKREMMERALGAMGSSLPSLVGQLGGTLKNKLESLTSGFISDTAEKTMALLHKGSELLVKATEYANLDGLVGMVQELTGDFELISLIDIEAESAVLAAFMDQLVEYGIPELIDDVIAMARTDEVRDNAMAWVSTRAIYGSDMDLVFKSVNTVGVTRFLRENPNGINDILNAYYLPDNIMPSQMADQRVKLLTVLHAINPNWYQARRANTWVPNLDAFSVASPDAKTLLLMEDPLRTYVMAGQEYQARPARDIIKDLYPNAYIS